MADRFREDSSNRSNSGLYLVLIYELLHIKCNSLFLLQKSSQIKKTAHHTTCPLIIEDIDNDNLFNGLVTSRYDSSMVYTTNASVIICFFKINYCMLKFFDYITIVSTNSLKIY